MNAEQLLTHFDRISDASDAIPRLRRFILDLAVRGKLVEQDPRDEPASELVKRIQAKKERLVEGKIGKQEPLPPIDSESIPFAVPKHWAWLQLTGIGLLSGGMTPSKNRSDFWEGDINWFSPKDIKTDYLVDSELKITSTGVTETGLQLYQPGCLFIVARSGILKRTFPVSINRVEATANQDLKVLNPFIEGLERYLQIMFRGMTDFILSTLVKTGTTVQSLKYAEFELQPFPLPPLGEQHRIVAKVDELMALCDRLEAAQAERESLRNRLVASSLNRLNNGAEGDAFREHARFYFNHLPRLATCPEHIQQLRQTILNLAVRGKLSPTSNWPQQPNVLGEAASLQNGYAFKSEWFASTGIRLLRNANVSHGILRWDDLACLPRNRADEFGRFQLNEGDVVLSLDRPFIVTGTKAARVRSEDMPCLLLQRVGRFELSVERICSDYVFLWLHSPHFIGQINPGRSNGVPHVSSKQVEGAEIFLPPIAEQRRIVAKVEELLALCDQLEAQLTTTQSECRRLLEAVLAEALTAQAEMN